jgi:flavodoxin
MKTLVVYQSKNGTTRKFAEKIADKLQQNQNDVIVKDVNETTNDDLTSCDLLFMGCWTSGKFIFGQKPEQSWVEFASKLPQAESKKTVLFTTYKIATGSMFKNMKKHILPKGYKVVGSMKSRNGKIDYYSNIILKYSTN